MRHHSLIKKSVLYIEDREKSEIYLVNNFQTEIIFLERKIEKTTRIERRTINQTGVERLIDSVVFQNLSKKICSVLRRVWKYDIERFGVELVKMLRKLNSRGKNFLFNIQLIIDVTLFGARVGYLLRQVFSVL